MKPISFARPCIAIVLLCQLAMWQAHAATREQSLLAAYPADSIATVNMANAALDDIEPARRETEGQFADQQAACLGKFFISSCLADAREVRRRELYNIRKVEVEARAFLRKDRASERERIVAERQNRAVRPLESPSIPISGAAREAEASGVAPGAQQNSPAEKP